MLRSKSVELVNVGCPIKNGHDVRKNKMKIAAWLVFSVLDTVSLQIKESHNPLKNRVFFGMFFFSLDQILINVEKLSIISVMRVYLFLYTNYSE